MRNRTLNRWWATFTGRFWLPCYHCGQETGGHEWQDGPNGEQSSIPVSGDIRSGIHSKGICADCTAAGVGDRAWEAFGIRRVG